MTGGTADDTPTVHTGPPATPPRAASPTGPRPALMIGGRLGRFVVVDVVGEGGLGRVYAAYDPELGRKIAVKLIKVAPELFSDFDRYREILLKEAQAMARLSHPNVVAVYDVGVHEGDVFLAMEYVEGVTLRRWLRSEPRAWKAVRDLFMQAGRGLAAAHQVGIVHRDFKPENLVVGEDGRVRVLDFGLARPMREGDGAALTVPGQAVMGTPPYMPPEQYARGETSALSDQFSFCVALYEALYGVRPFAGKSVFELSQAIVGGKVRAPPAGRRVPRWLHRLIMRGLSVEPSRRYPSMRALLDDLSRDRLQQVRRGLVVLGLLAVVLSVGATLREWTRGGSVEVHVRVGEGPAPAGVVVRLDEVALAVEDGTARGDAEPGLHRVRVEAPEHVAQEAILEVKRGGSHVVTIGLAHEQGLIDLLVSPRDAEVRIDGVDFGSRPRRVPLDTGEHTIHVRRAGHYEVERPWSVRADEERSGYVYLPRAVRWSRPQTGIVRTPRVIGDITGDGRPEILHGSYNELMVTDPWTDRDLWRTNLGSTKDAPHEVRARDGESALDLVALRHEGRRWRLAAWVIAAGDPPYPPLWQVDGVRKLVGPGFLALVDGDGERLALTNVLAPKKLSSRSGTSGRRRWDLALPGSVAAMVTGRGAEGESVVFVVTQQGVLAAAAATGKRRWRASVPAVIFSADKPWLEARALPLDATPGDDLLVVRHGAPGSVAAFAGATGARLWDRSWPDAGVDDLAVDDGEGTVVLGVVVPGKEVMVLGGDGGVRWRHADAGAQSTCRFVPAPPGGPPRLCVVTKSGISLRSGAQGTVEAELSIPGADKRTIASVDWDGDGAHEVVVGSREGVVSVLHADGRVAARVFIDEPIGGVQSIGDVDGDGLTDLLVGGKGPSLVLGPKILWARTAKDAFRAAPQLVDVDGDGAPEVVVVGHFDRAAELAAFDPRTGTERMHSTPLGDVIRAPAVVHRAQGLAFIVTPGGGLVTVSARDGSVPETRSFGLSYATPAVGDLDGDGSEELVVLPWSDKDPLGVFRAEDLEPLWTLALPDGGWATPLIGDVDGVAGPEVVVGLNNGSLLVIDPRARKVVWRRDVGGRVVFEPTLVDLEGDGEPELITQAANGGKDLLCLRARDGKPRWRAAGSGSIHGVVRVLEPRAEGESRSLVVATFEGGARGLSIAGAPLWRYQPEPPAPRLSGPPVLADLDRDGREEFIFASDEGILHVLDATTGALRWRQETGGEPIEAPPLVHDVDADGRAEVIIGSRDRSLYVLRDRTP